MQRVNMMAPDFRANPYPVYAEMRRSPTLTQFDPTGFWAVSRYDDLIAALKNPRLYSSDAWSGKLRPYWVRDNPLADSLVAIDPPRHTKLRNLVSTAFTTAAVARLEPRIREFVKQLTDKALEKQDIDFVGEFSAPLTSSIIGSILGMDPSFNPRLKQWVDALAATTAGTPSADKIQVIKAALADAREFLTEVINSRKKQPGEDMVSHLLQCKVDGETLTDEEVLCFCLLLLAAGRETTSQLLSLTMLTLCEHPEALQRVRANPQQLIPRAVDEVLRYRPSVPNLYRRTTAATELGGSQLPEGAVLVLLLLSANRDEKYFPDGERFDLDRDPQQSHMAFGYGAHYCLGAGLGRMEVYTALGELLSRTRDFSLRSPDLKRRSAFGSLVLPTLPLHLTPA